MNTKLVEPKTYDGRRNDLATFLNWVQAGDVAFVPAATFDLSTLRLEGADSGPVKTISAEQLDRLLAKARTRSLYAELCVSGQAHQGFRTREIDRMYFYMFDLRENRIVLPKVCQVTGLRVTKSGHFRQPRMQPAFRRRLEEIIKEFHPAPNDPINPGYTWEEQCPDMARSVGIVWSNNVLRHGYGAHRRAQTQNIYLVAEEMGTSPAYVRDNYSLPVAPSETQQWLELPDGWEKLVVPGTSQIQHNI
jgi:hypothetical protein